MFSRIIVLLVFTLMSFPMIAQLQSLPRRYINKIIRDTTEISKPQLMVYPVLAVKQKRLFQGLYLDSLIMEQHNGK
jgi:hypothetical protein